MKKLVYLTVALLGLAGLAQAQVKVGISVGGGDDSFHLAIGSYYHAPEAEVAVCQQRNIPDDEMPVVFFVAQRVHVAPGVIINLRAGGTPWVDIFRRYRINPRVLYVPLHANVVGTPYAGYYAYYRGHGRVRLADADIVNMVNLKFASDYYHHTPDEVMRLRAQGRSYGDIHAQYHPMPGHDNGRRPAMDKDRRNDRRDDRKDDRRNDRRDDDRH